MSRPHRLPGFSYLGPSRYFLTLCTHRRASAFRSPDVVQRTLLEFFRTSHYASFAVLAYCFMPDHLHLLVEGTSAWSDLQAFVTVAKRCSGTAHAAIHGTPLWQEGYHERVLRPTDDPRAIARYILENPVRAGLVQSPTAYPFLGSGLWSVAELLDSVSK
ncbi:MAG: transposase [Vicinamibacterales bacterium]